MLARTSVSVRTKYITVLWKQGVESDTEVMVKKPETTIQNNKDKNLLTVVAIPSNI